MRRSALSFAAILFRSLPQICGQHLAGRYENTTVTTTTTSSVAIVTAKPEFCYCLLTGFVWGDYWYDVVYNITDYTMIYTIDHGSHSTIGSSLLHVNRTSTLNYSSISSSLADQWNYGGKVQFETLNTVPNAALTTLQASIGMHIDYSLDTVTNIAGTTLCARVEQYWNFLTLPEYFYHTITTSYAFVLGQAKPIDLAQMAAAKIITESVQGILGISSCMYGLHGMGTLKIGVSQLTAVSNVYINAATVTTTPADPPQTTIAPPNTYTPPPPQNTPIPAPPTVTPTPPYVEPPPASTFLPPSPPPPPEEEHENPRPTENSPVQPPPAATNNPPDKPAETQPGPVKNPPRPEYTPAERPPPPPPSTNIPDSNNPSNPNPPQNAATTIPATLAQPERTVPTTAVLTIGSSTITVVALAFSSGYVVGSTTLTAGGAALTIGPAILTANAADLSVISPVDPAAPVDVASLILSFLGGPQAQNPQSPQTVPLPNDAAAVNSQLVSIFAAPGISGAVVVGSQTLTLPAGGGTIVVGGKTVVLPSAGGSSIVVDGKTIALPPASLDSSGRTTSILFGGRSGSAVGSKGGSLATATATQKGTENSTSPVEFVAGAGSYSVRYWWTTGGLVVIACLFVLV